jgi:hypothetical protein
MITTKMSEKEAKEYLSGPATSADAPAYDYGTRLCLGNDLLKRLGFSTPPAVGTEMLLTAKVVVTSTGVNQQQDGDKEVRCELQLTEMDLSAQGKDAATVLYGGA